MACVQLLLLVLFNIHEAKRRMAYYDFFRFFFFLLVSSSASVVVGVVVVVTEELPVALTHKLATPRTTINGIVM